MKIVINNQHVEGNLEDLVLLLQNSKPKSTKIPVKTAEENQPQASPVDESLKESEELRKKLAENPEYNPHTGVVPSTEPAIPDQQYNRSYTAENETGISYE